MDRDRYRQNLEKLKNLNFPEQTCIEALRSARGDVQIAADLLFQDQPTDMSIDEPSLGNDIRIEESRAPRPRAEAPPPPSHKSSKSYPSQPVAISNVKYRSVPNSRYLQNDAIPMLPTSGPKLPYREESEIGLGRSKLSMSARRPDKNVDRKRNYLGSSPVNPNRNTEAKQQLPAPPPPPDEIPPFIPHMSLNAAKRLQVGSKLDHRDDVGKSLKSVIKKEGPDYRTFRIHYEGWASKWDTVSDPVKDLWRYSEYNTLSQRPVLRKEMAGLNVGDMIDINPRRHPGWKHGTIRYLDMNQRTGKRNSGQVQVQYTAMGVVRGEKKPKEYLFWVHLDNAEEVAPFPTKSAPETLTPTQSSYLSPHLGTSRRRQEDEEIVNKFQKDQWLEVKDQGRNWEPAVVVSVEDNYITVHYERWSSRWDVTLHVVRDKYRIRELGGAIPESQFEKTKREELAMAKEMLKERGSTLVDMEEDGNCLYRAWAYQIYGDAEKYHMKVRKECCDYVEKHQDFFGLYMPGFHEELAKKRVKGEWGDHVDIVAMSELYNVPVKIFQLNFEAKMLVETWCWIEELSEKGLSLPQVLLCRHRQKHYNAVIPTNFKMPLSMSQRNGRHIRKFRESLERMEQKSIKEDEKVQEAKEELLPSTSSMMDELRASLLVPTFTQSGSSSLAFASQRSYRFSTSRSIHTRPRNRSRKAESYLGFSPKESEEDD